MYLYDQIPSTSHIHTHISISAYLYFQFFTFLNVFRFQEVLLHSLDSKMDSLSAPCVCPSAGSQLSADEMKLLAKLEEQNRSLLHTLFPRSNNTSNIHITLLTHLCFLHCHQITRSRVKFKEHHLFSTYQKQPIFIFLLTFSIKLTFLLDVFFKFI